MKKIESQNPFAGNIYTLKGVQYAIVETTEKKVEDDTIYCSVVVEIKNGQSVNKTIKDYKLANITIEHKGEVYKANSLHRNSMLQKASVLGEETVEWYDIDNNKKPLNKQDLEEIVKKALEEQEKILDTYQ